MVCKNCSSKSGCQTSRCDCKRDGENCNSDCECDPDVCTNRIKGCECSSRSRCITERCECRASKAICDPSICDCSESICENKIKKSKIQSSSSIINSNKNLIDLENSTVNDLKIKNLKNESESSEDDFFKFSSELKNSIETQVTHKRDTVIEYRQGKDLYTGDDARKLDNPEVDHIIETQILAHSTAKVLYKTKNYLPFQNNLKESINILDNYNVTRQDINRSKGSIIKSYLHEKRYEGKNEMPFLPYVLNLKSESKLKLYAEPVNNQMLESGPIVVEYLETGKRDDGHVSGRNSFVEMADSLSELLGKMLIDIDSERSTRSKKRGK